MYVFTFTEKQSCDEGVSDDICEKRRKHEMFHYVIGGHMSNINNSRIIYWKKIMCCLTISEMN
jgi:hypothetical protein